MTEQKKKEEKKSTLTLYVVAEEKGSHQDTGEALHNVHFEPVALTHEQYKLFKLKELDSDTGGVEVEIV